MSKATNVESTMPRTYWVVGGEYETMNFERLVQGTQVVLGPFGCPEDAQCAWRDLSDKARSHATMRFTIAYEPSGASL
jgi:hypothetical protein